MWVERDQKKKVRRTYAIVRDISEAKQLEKEKLEKEKLYSTKILLKEMEREKTELEERFLQNINTLLLPTLEKLKGQDLPEITNSYLSLLEDNLKKISSPLLEKLSTFYQNFSPREIEVAELIRKGKSSKEIGEMLYISPSAVNFHRLNIRKKIGIKSTKQNLQVVLKSFS
jgi:DNA-binding CsgD family transcriptional regulator